MVAGELGAVPMKKKGNRTRDWRQSTALRSKLGDSAGGEAFDRRRVDKRTLFFFLFPSVYGGLNQS